MAGIQSSLEEYKERLLRDLFDRKPSELTVEAEEISRGAYGVVLKGIFGEQPVAVKKIHQLLWGNAVSKEETRYLIEGFAKEARMLAGLSHAHVVKSFGAFFDSNSREPILVMELMATDLRAFLKQNKGTLRLGQQLSFVWQVASGVQHLHHLSPPLAHRDLNDKNVLLAFDRTTVKIGDLGQAKYKQASEYFNSKAPGSVHFMPPEATSDKPHYTISVDVYSLGVLAVEIATQCEPSPSTHGIGFIPEVERRAGDLAKMTASHPLKSLAVRCLSNDYKQRPVIDQLVSELMAMLCTGCDEMAVLKDNLAQLEQNHSAAMEEIMAVLKDNLAQLEQKHSAAMKEMEEKNAVLCTGFKEVAVLRDNLAQVEQKHSAAVKDVEDKNFGLMEKLKKLEADNDHRLKEQDEKLVKLNEEQEKIISALQEKEPSQGRHLGGGAAVWENPPLKQTFQSPPGGILESSFYAFPSELHGMEFAKLQPQASPKAALTYPAIGSREKCKIPSCPNKRSLSEWVLEDFCGERCAGTAKIECISPEMMMWSVPPGSKEFKAVCDFFLSAWKKGTTPDRNSVRAILYIDYSRLNKQYSSYIAKDLGGVAKEVDYFHGTTLRCDLAGTGKACRQPSCGACGISRSGFSTSKIGSHVKFLRLGKAFYFAEHSSKCHEYTEGQGECRALVLCKVALGKVYEAKRDMVELKKPPKGYNSVAATPGTHPMMNYREVATYTPGSILPKYIILYQHQGLKLLLR